eukprot:8745135-Heterocapsa_arctica.AAC.1
MQENAASDQAIDRATQERGEFTHQLARPGITEQERIQFTQLFNLANKRFWEAHATKRQQQLDRQSRQAVLAGRPGSVQIVLQEYRPEVTAA